MFELFLFLVKKTNKENKWQKAHLFSRKPFLFSLLSARTWSTHMTASVQSIQARRLEHHNFVSGAVRDERTQFFCNLSLMLNFNHY